MCVRIGQNAMKIPRDFQYLQPQQSVMDHDNASEVSGNISESHPSVSGECSKSHATVDSASTEAVGTSTDEYAI
ncbi:unnamed protein product [Acanthoscelides obtectus]|uniref:Uncharacterized protein n=1 Tax=Acanthoscelides obtectus TaxID=200917 RepID=A0A9P0P853_ACAOB|nr:unnamed protein product [Acanthoscelides obtectus]CAK1632423.1 hypothetical protein AOBTE_LOCUS7553 [Acanthoscelides obtectus]